MPFNHALVRVTTLLATTLVVGLMVGAIWCYQRRCFDPAALGHDELLEWLVTYDLEEVSPQTRCLLAKRLDEGFSGEMDWKAVNDQLTPRHRAQLWKNVPLILEPWFLDKVRRYHECETSDRMAFLDRAIDTLTVWKGLDALSPPSGQGDGDWGEMETLLRRQIAVWRDRAKPDQQQRIDQLVSAIEVRWLFRQLAGTLDEANRPNSQS